MAYSTEIAKLVTDRLIKFATLNRHQLAGHVANLEFWLAEVQHSLDLIDGYGPRFEQMTAGQEKYVAEHSTIEFSFRDPCCVQWPAEAPKRVPKDELNRARRSLCDTTYWFLVRSYNDGFVNEATLRGICGDLDIGIEATVLKDRNV